MINKITRGKKRSSSQSLFAFLIIVLLSFSSGSSHLVSAGKQERKKQNLLLITVDTLRADWLSCYSREHAQTTNIDALAERGTVFLRAFANTSTTLPSHTNILLGVTPLYHGVHENSNFVVREEFLTLAEHLKNNRYSTGAFVGAFPLEARFGLNQGFDTYDDELGRKQFQNVSSAERKAEVVVDRALDWLKKQTSAWFLWVHCWDPHEPYEPPEPFRTQYREQPYTGEVAYVDSVLRKLFVYLEESDLFEDTLIIFTGDHGESLGEHGEKTHGFFAYNTTTWVPLIIVSPGSKKNRVEDYVSHIDIFPTVCDILNLDKLPFLQGVSLRPALDGKKMPKRNIYFESLHPYYSKGWAPLRGYIFPGEKYISSPIPELYDLDEDFHELRNLAQNRELEKYESRLKKIISEQTSPEGKGAEKILDRESIEKLKSLGYISSSLEGRKESFGPEDDIKVLLPYYYRAIEAVAVYEEGRVREGFEILKKIITERNNVDVAYINLASLYKREGRLGDAVEVIRLAHENIPSNYLLFFTMVNYLLDAQLYDLAIEAFEGRSYSQAEFDPEIWNCVGIAYSKVGEFEKAIEMYTRALPLDSESAALYTNLGEAQAALYVKKNDKAILKEAIRSFLKAVELDPEYSLAYDNLGKTYKLEGNLDAAINAFRRALELNNKLDDALYILGLSYLEKGEKARALNTFLLYKEKYYSALPEEYRQKLDSLIKKSGEEEK